MEAAAASEAANDVPLTSKLSPFVKPFVPRRFQTEAQPATFDPAHEQQPPAQPEPTQQATVSGRAAQSNYNASYASGGLNARASGYAAADPRRAHHYIPFLSGPYALQDYQTGYGLYPYPVFMFEEMATPGSFVSPGTFVCPRASLKPQRRNPRKSVFPTTAISTATATTTTTTSTTTNAKNDVRPTVSKARIDGVSSRIVENGGVATINTGLQKLKTVHNRTALAKNKSNETEFAAARSFSGKQQPKTSERQSDKSTVTTNGDISCLSTAVSTSTDAHAVLDTTAIAVKETKDVLPTHVNVNRGSSSCPKSKSFADIIRQQNSSAVDDTVYSLNDRRGVLRRRNSNINESVKTKTNSTPEVKQHLDTRQLDDSSIETRYKSADAGKQKQQLEHNRWTPVLSRSSRRASENSDSSSVRSQNKNSNRQRNNRMHQTSKVIPTRPDMLLEHSDSVPAVSCTLEPPNIVKSEADDDADTWTEVRSSRRWKDMKNNRRPTAQATKERQGIVSERLNSARSADTTSHDQSMCKSVKTHQVSVGETDEVKTAAGLTKLCNASKTLKHASGNHLEKGLSVNHSEKSKSEVNMHIEKSKAEAETEKPRISDKAKHADRSKIAESDSTVEPAEVSKVPAAVAAKKKKRKTDGQSKQDFRNKLKTLPSIQGKVLTVTEEFYNQLKGNPDVLDQQQCAVASGSRDFKADDFPFLSSDANISTLLNINSDDSWSDIECSLETSAKCGGANKTTTAAVITRTKSSGLDEFPALGNFMEPLIASETTSYSSLLKKNFWSLPPRITPADSLMMKGGGGGGSSSPAFWEKLLAESSLDDFQASTKRESNVIVGGMKATSKESFASHATISAATESMPMTCKRTEHKPKKPKSASLVQISLINLLKKKEKRSKKIPMRLHPLSSKDAKGVRKVRPFVANILDSTAPLRRRGKEREKPAKKKQSALKKVILKERIERKLVRDSIASEQLEGDAVTPRNSLDAKESASTNSALSDVETTVVTAKQKIHSGKFREYCNQMLNPAIDDAVQKLIGDLIRFHDRLYQRDPVKAKIRRRMVVGLREVGKHLKLKKIKCLILAPNLERIQSTGGLDDAMYSVIGLAREQNIPFVFALGRRRLGRVCLKKVPVSCVGIFNYEGSEVNFNRLCELAASARDAYQRTLSQVIEGFAELSTDEQ